MEIYMVSCRGKLWIEILAKVHNRFPIFLLISCEIILSGSDENFTPKNRPENADEILYNLH